MEGREKSQGGVIWGEGEEWAVGLLLTTAAPPAGGFQRDASRAAVGNGFDLAYSSLFRVVWWWTLEDDAGGQGDQQQPGKGGTWVRR
jgi:hypothetical protein